MSESSTGSPFPWKQGLIQISFSVYPNQAQTSKKKKGNMSDAHSWKLTPYIIVGWRGRQNSSEQLPNGQRLTKQSVSKPNFGPFSRFLPLTFCASGMVSMALRLMAVVFALGVDTWSALCWGRDTALTLVPRGQSWPFCSLFSRVFSKGCERGGARFLTTYRWPPRSIF